MSSRQSQLRPHAISCGPSKPDNLRYEFNVIHRGVIGSYVPRSQLIDWYPGSSVLAMRRSVRKLLGRVTQGLRVALPGHNGVIEGDKRFCAACERHLEMSASAARTARKAALSRPRARATLALNSRVTSVPERVREWMKT